MVCHCPSGIDAFTDASSFAAVINALLPLTAGLGLAKMSESHGGVGEVRNARGAKRIWPRKNNLEVTLACSPDEAIAGAVEKVLAQLTRDS